MMNVSKHVKTLGLAIAGIALTAALAAPASADGNRYDLPRAYNGEVSSAKAYLLINNNNDNKDVPTVLIDVRKLVEHAAGHPKGSFNIPFPHIVSANDQDPQVFIDEAVKAVKGNLDTPVLTLCRSGFRSVLAANLLAGAGFTNVRNIWEGFEGVVKSARGSSDENIDINNDGVVDSNDKDGWKFYQELPYTTHVTPARAYLGDVSLY